ncbi:TonB-dependent receptor [Pedobacter sp. SYSU D00535]|uniref:TonB-dependent receptor n=1 Tax=Pedobacter sp. SYSU D00535 TaxID=2810308 RepID=UPI001A973AB1|nr:TonB-dependent receptor [Pedobacter sp. SYSU D00535]
MLRNLKVRILPIAILLLTTSLSAYAQKTFVVKGSVKDSTGASLPGALVKLVSTADSLATSTDANGEFRFNSVKFDAFTLKAAFIGFQSYSRQFKNQSGESLFTIPAIILREKSNTLKEVVISGVPPVLVKEDTIQFNASAYPVREGDAVEEVIKKLPGVSVDKDGKVTTQGKEITRVRVNGKDFFGTDVATAIQNLPADIVQNLQIVDDYGDQAKETGIKTGEPEKILNINIQPEKKKGYFARGIGGMGNENRYIASIRANTFKGERQISAIGNLNNTNLRGGGGNGITNNRNIALNYKNEWGKKLQADGGYRFNNRDNKTISSNYRQTFYSDFTRVVDGNSNNRSVNNAHDSWANIEFRPDTLNFFKLSPRLGFNASNNDNRGSNLTTIRQASSFRDSYGISSSASFNVGTNLFYNHRFKKKGRNFSLWGTVNLSNSESDRDSRNDYLDINGQGEQTDRKQYQLTESLNDNFRTGANLTYSEPFGKGKYLDLRYNWSFSDTRNGRSLNDVDPDTREQVFNADQSNNYQYQFTTNSVGLNYRFIHQKYNYSLGLDAQPTVLRGQDISRNISTLKETFNWIPSARLVYRFQKQKSLTANYSGRSNQPSFTQLQPIRDSTNLQNVVAGNKDLSPEFTHGLNLEYNQSDWKAGNMIFGNLSFSKTDNKIVTTRALMSDSTRQITSYTNTDGFYNLRGNYSYAKPFADRRYTVTYYGGANFNNNIGFSNGDRNVGRNLVVDQGLKFRLDIKDIIDAELNTNYSINTTRYSMATFSDRKANRLVFSLEGRNYFFEDLTLGYDFSKTINRGFNSGNPNPTILNLYTEYRFLKGNIGTIRLQGFDLFNQNTGISRDVFDNEIVDSRSNRLGRYFLLSFNLRLRKFG